MTKPIQLFSEIGRLKTVMLHRPGVELENLMPDYLDRFLFDDIPFLQQAQKEHDFFADTLRKNDVQVLYLEDLAAETLVSSEAKEMFLNSYLDEAMIQEDFMRKEVFDFFMSIKDPRVLIDHTMAGLKKNELTIPPRLNLTSLTSLVEESYPFLIDPMPNLYFTRDPFATIGNSVSMNRMYAPTRRRETLYGNQIFHHHPLFAENQTNFLYHRDDTTRIEGGDQLILSDKLVAIGISQRTEVASIEKIAQTIFDTEPSFEHILAFNIGEERKFMHLDTVFTMVDVDKFTIHPEIEGELSVYSISKHQGGVQIFEERDTLENILCRYLDLPEVALIRCGGDDLTAAAREQWNDGSNTLAIAPGEVVVYDRNIVTNQLLKSAGVKLNEVPGSELVRGRGGPRCMSMPFVREV
ncbi:arginine deiminase [Enterococcus sp. 8G7_MSG3316]|uniref:Arginine deiminase n=1 Tax=Candidatus Enterococcus testudinis TaxID=1834191 RepID=A0A242A974_9ENTE|nr:arginine deiminase [Enterococcus sp. 8G7_MSG3316]OTN77163.1 arginine deiminase [Enterococcus sp. 8G7_MSG3316]